MVIAAANRMMEMRTMIMEAAKRARARPGAGSVVTMEPDHGNEMAKVKGILNLRPNVSAADVDNRTNRT